MREEGGMCPGTPRTREDALLYAYWEQEKGRVYTEVPLAGPRGNAAWTTGSTTRCLDGVRLPAEADVQGILPFTGHAKEFSRAIQCHPPDVIEVKRQLNRTAIAQIIAGHDLFERQYGVTPVRLIIICAVGDAALEWVCLKRGIVVRKLLQHSYPHQQRADCSC